MSFPAGSDERELARDRAIVASTHNTARYFTEVRHVAWVALAFTLLWGLYGYDRMSKIPEPLLEVRVAVATAAWPGAEAEKVEQLVTRRIEQKLAENANLEKIESVSRTGLSLVYVTLKEDTPDRKRELDDLQGRLDTIRDLPEGAGPVELQKDFADTATLLLTVASPRVGSVELELRARALAQAIGALRAAAPAANGPRAALVLCFPASLQSGSLHRLGSKLQHYLNERLGTSDARLLEGPGFLGVDVSTALDDASLLQAARSFAQRSVHLSELHPDVWRTFALVRDPRDTLASLRRIAGDRYSYRQLDDFSELIQRHLQGVPGVARVTRAGVLPEQVLLEYSQERLASYGLQPSAIEQRIASRNISAPGGVLEVSSKNVRIDPSGEFKSEQEIGSVMVGAARAGVPLYLRDLVDVSREYASPPRFLSYLSSRSPSGAFERTRAVTLAVTMHPGAQIADFAARVDARLAGVQKLLPEDLILRRTSDHARQVEESVGLFMRSLCEAIALVVIVALVGFWEWRAALLLALSIPITIAMTFGLMHLFRIDIQGVSIASLIIALGLLVDDPVVASDAIKRSIAQGWVPRVAAWLGPTKLATAILFATLTNIAAYLPFLALPGETGAFVYSLPVVITLALVASRIVSMTFVPLLGSVLLRAGHERSARELRAHGFGKLFYRAGGWAIDHREYVLGASLVLLVVAFAIGSHVRSAFFPKDLSHLSFVDIWLPEDSPLAATEEAAARAAAIVRAAAVEFGAAHPEGGQPREVLDSVTEFIGGSSPRFWLNVAPVFPQSNFAQLLIQVKRNDDTLALVPLLQERLSRGVAGARIDVRELDAGKPVGPPVGVRIAGDDIGQLRGLAEQVKAMLRAIPSARRVRDDWGGDTFAVKLEVDPDRANMAGVSNLDVALSSAAALNGHTVGTLRDGDRNIPIVSRLRSDERAELSDIENLYVSSGIAPSMVPLRQVSRLSYAMQTEKICRRNQFRTITVSAFPADRVLASEVMAEALPGIEALRANLPPGYSLEIGGEHEEQLKGFADLNVVLAIMIAAIYAALVVQFRNAIKPLIVFAVLPSGAAGALVSLVVTDTPFSFMAFLGVISLMGVIVSHVIVLFDCIEEMHARGTALREALLDACLLRLRPVLVTVAATVLGLLPLVLHGGPLWRPLCLAQIGGLTAATLLTLLLVPVLYTILIRDLGWIAWQAPKHKQKQGPRPAARRAAV